MGCLSRARVQIFLLLDEDQKKNPSCSWQRETVESLLEVAGARNLQVRSFSHKKGFSALRSKTWCGGNRACVGGPFTRTADSSNEEHWNGDVVATHERWFYDLWERAEAVTAEAIALLRQRKAEKSPSVSRCGRAAKPAVPAAAAATVELLALPPVPESRYPSPQREGRG